MTQKKLDDLKNKPSPEVTKAKIQKALLEQVDDRKKGYAKLQVGTGEETNANVQASMSPIRHRH